MQTSKQHSWWWQYLSTCSLSSLLWKYTRIMPFVVYSKALWGVQFLQNSSTNGMFASCPIDCNTSQLSSEECSKETRPDFALSWLFTLQTNSKDSCGKDGTFVMLFSKCCFQVLLQMSFLSFWDNWFCMVGTPSEGRSFRMSPMQMWTRIHTECTGRHGNHIKLQPPTNVSKSFLSSEILQYLLLVNAQPYQLLNPLCLGWKLFWTTVNHRREITKVTQLHISQFCDAMRAISIASSDRTIQPSSDQEQNHTLLSLQFLWDPQYIDQFSKQMSLPSKKLFVSSPAAGLPITGSRKETSNQTQQMINKRMGPTHLWVAAFFLCVFFGGGKQENLKAWSPTHYQMKIPREKEAPTYITVLVPHWTEVQHGVASARDFPLELGGWCCQVQCVPGLCRFHFSPFPCIYCTAREVAFPDVASRLQSFPFLYFFFKIVFSVDWARQENNTKVAHQKYQMELYQPQEFWRELAC